jgi:hypothetical protein
MLSRVGVALAVATAAGVVVTVVGVVVTVVGVVVTVAGSAAVTAAVGLPEDMVVGLAAAASVAVGLGVVASGVARLAVSGVGSVVSAEPRSVAGSAELDLTASTAEASASLAFAGTEAFPSRQV